MKKSLLAVAALTAFAGAASAQSSVTLFGILDLNIRQVDNSGAVLGKLRSLSTDGNASSRLGFRGIEDLGGGLRAGFWLEGALSPDVGGGQKLVGTGASSTSMDWQRRSTVSLIGNFGEIRLGRDYTATFNQFGAYDPFGYVGVASSSNMRSVINSTAATAVRASNMIGYFLPTLGGLYGQLQYAFGEGSQGNEYRGARVGYAAGPLNVSAAYGRTRKTGTMTDDLRVGGLGASFNLGFMTIQGLVEKSDYSSEQQKYMLLAAVIPVGQGNIKLSGIRTVGKTSLGNGHKYSGTQLGLGYVYDLSKRSAVYAQFGRIDNAGSAAANFGGTFTASSGGNPFVSGGQKSTGIEFGVRHSF